MSQSAAIVTTLKNAGPSLDSFIKYHLAIGFSKLFLFFDDPADRDLARAQTYDDVIVIKNDARLRRRWEKTHMAAAKQYVYGFRKAEVSVRQELNVEVAVELALKKKIGWLLHIDSDELFYPLCGLVPEHFQTLAAQGIDNVIYANYEALHDTFDPVNPFRSVTTFKKNFEMFPEEILSREQRKLTNSIPQLRDRFFLFYSNGKSAARLDTNLVADGVHRFRFDKTLRSRRKLKPKISRDALILHYPCCGFTNFWRKYKTRGPFADTWFDIVDIAEAIGSLHLESRDVVLQQGKRKAREFYRQRILISKSAARRLVASEIACRMDGPAKILRRLGK